LTKSTKNKFFGLSQILYVLYDSPRAFHNFSDTADARCFRHHHVSMATANRAVDQIIRAYSNGWLRGHYRRPLRLHWQHEERETALCFVFHSTQSVLYMQTKLLKWRSQLQPETIQFAFENPVLVIPTLRAF
jgi:hypothetical protein